MTARGDALLYGPAQYRWSDEGPASHPSRDLPPAHVPMHGRAQLSLPADSIAVVVL
jgi:hypothetical protein